MANWIWERETVMTVTRLSSLLLLEKVSIWQAEIVEWDERVRSLKKVVMTAGALRS